jgi:peptidoglycan lytic transglycosylase G
VSEYGPGWPQDPRPPRQPRGHQNPQRPQGSHRRPDQDAWPHDQSGERNRYGQDPYAEPEPYEDEYETGDRFVPGFGEEGDAEYGDGRTARAGRGSRRAPRRRQAGRGGGRGGRPRRRFRWIAPLVALLVIVVPLAVGGVWAYRLYMSKYHPADYSGSGTGSVVVQVVSGDSPTSLGPKLVRLGVVASSRAFVLAAEHSTSAAGLLPGFYGMHRHMQASLAYALLLDPANLVQVKVTIPEGWRLSQIVSYLGAKSGLPASAYRQALKNPASLGLPAFANGKPEGYLFPATYNVQPHETALGVLKGMVQRFDQEAATVGLPAAASRVHLSQAQVVIMASLVQAEGGRLSDYPKIARVIYNRLARGMPLQLDSAVLYGLNKFGILATNRQLASSSPYNTYKHKGLPPGPIDSPGNAAIQAVLHPATATWLYFVTVNPKTGETRYTSSSAQFQQFRQELAHNLAKG